MNTTKSKKRKGEEPSDKSALLGSLHLAEKRRKVGGHGEGEGEGGADIIQDEHSYNQPGKCSKEKKNLVSGIIQESNKGLNTSSYVQCNMYNIAIIF